MFRVSRFILAVLASVALAGPAFAQTVSSTDIQRLQDSVYQAGNDLQQFRGRDTDRSGQLQSELDDLRDEVIYLKVKLRKDNVSRREYADLRDRIDDLRSRARNDSTSSSRFPAAAPGSGGLGSGNQGSTSGPSRTTARPGEVPAGTELDVRLQQPLNSGTAQVEDRFEATTLTDVTVDGRVVIPTGALMRGIISSVEPATRTNRTAKMTVAFDQVTVNGRDYAMRGTVTKAIEGEGIRGEAGRAGAGAGVGAIIGGILGGVKGALAGILIGGGGVIAATEGKQVELPQGAVLTVRIDSPLNIPPSRR